MSVKLLYITSLSGKRINSFMRSAIVAATNIGYEFVMACNMDMADKEGYEEDCREYGIRTVHIDFDRNPLAKKNKKAKQQLLKLMKEETFDIVHCNTPIGGYLGRICAKKEKIPYVIYQAHGFHFWKGAPLKNWLIYYPIERKLARYTDLLITINNEDYLSAKHFHLRNHGRVIKINGVGVPRKERKLSAKEREEKREELHANALTKVFISAGELNDNKNHMVAIEAFSKLNRRDWLYLICGQGELKDKLEQRIEELNLKENISLLGFRDDLPDLLEISDVFVFPSKREGLSAALMEAMEAGLPCVAGKIRGNKDLLPNSTLLFNPNNTEELKDSLEKAFDEVLINEEIKKNVERIKHFEFDFIVSELVRVYRDIRDQIE